MFISNSFISCYKPSEIKNNFDTKKTASQAISINRNSRDIFVKQKKPVSFGNSQNFHDKYELFAKDIESYVLNHCELKINDLRTIVQKYSPATDVKDFRQMPDKSNATIKSQAYFTNMINFTNSEAIAENKTIFVRIPEKNNIINALEFLEAIEHEFTHILQEESKDRISKVDFLNNYLKKVQLNSSFIDTVKTMPKAFAEIEYNLNIPLIKVLKKNNELPIQIYGNPEDILRNMYLKETGFTPEDFIKKIVQYVYKNIEANGIKFDKQAVTDYIALLADKEKEAYQNSLDMLKKYCNIKGLSDLDLRIKLYEILQKTVKNI